MLDDRETVIVDFLTKSPKVSSKEIYDQCSLKISYATLKRILAKLVDQNILKSIGQGKGTKYILSNSYELLAPVNLDEYFKSEIDERKIKTSFDTQVINTVLAEIDIFSDQERNFLNELQQQYLMNINQLSVHEFKQELERLAIDLSWKSSQIEGNTYSLLETEMLLKEKQEASGKTKEEAIMLLNHKEALDFIIENTDYLEPLAISKIENIHSVLTKDLRVERNLRTRRVGISGTNYRPLDNEFLIRDALNDTCNLINRKTNVFEKALLTLVLISYVQPFMDGNKRTARILSNALMINNNYCPLSFRTVDSIDYKKAMLLFYEQNNISSFKKIFIEQFEFAVKTYF